MGQALRRVGHQDERHVQQHAVLLVLGGAVPARTHTRAEGAAKSSASQQLLQRGSGGPNQANTVRRSALACGAEDQALHRQVVVLLMVRGQVMHGLMMHGLMMHRLTYGWPVYVQRIREWNQGCK